ncbi:hypothetical protein D6853_06605 [Butyrivibrio sp. X503]|uniref:hypothetical protein n=1 Tax=Butyrivibrio sp. X503 TaxID=2364878 RepID=UPI000EA9D142|nr:hypothetical protein [Butyrivibrio sp. X503]RKM56452.1 hypothetical protein D6853_06605 [Butyrivibrio sp. X503]
MRKSIWDWLETEPTKDINKIKAAYAEVAKKYHPAEHPEEFKQLRDSYKLAIELSKKEGAPAYRVISFDTGDEKLKFNLGSSKEEDKEFKFNLGSSKEKDKDLKYDLRDKDEAANRTKLDFSSVSDMETLNDRQKKMLKLFRDMIPTSSGDYKIYGHKKVMEAITYKWLQSPYKEEITPAFVSGLVDILKKSEYLDVDAYEVIEKLIFNEIQKNDLGNLHSQLLSIKNESAAVARREEVITNDQIEKCFYRHLDGTAPIAKFEPLSKIEKLFKKPFRITLFDDMLLFTAEEIKYYFYEELSFDVNRWNDRLTVYDSDKKVILTLAPTNQHYRLILGYLINSKCTYLGECRSGETGYIRKLNGFYKIWLPISKKRIHILKKVAVLLLVGVIGLSFNIFTRAVTDSTLDAFLHIITYLGFTACVFSLIFFAYFLIRMFFDFIILLLKIHVKRELFRDIIKGKAFYVTGGWLYIFDKYILYFSNSEPKIVPIRYIQWLKPDKKREDDFWPGLKICFNQGQMVSYDIRSVFFANAVIDHINSKRAEIIKISEDEEIRRKYEKLKYKKPGIFRRKFIIAKEVKETYTAACIIFFMTIIFMIQMILGIEQYGIEDSDMNFSIFLLGILIVSSIWTGYSLYSFHRYPTKLLVEVGIQMLKKNRYFNNIYSLYVLDDYFVSCSNFTLKIIPLVEVDSVEMGRGLTSHLLKIKMKDGKKKTFCRKITNYQDENVIGEIIRNIEGRLAC